MKFITERQSFTVITVVVMFFNIMLYLLVVEFESSVGCVGLFLSFVIQKFPKAPDHEVQDRVFI